MQGCVQNGGTKIIQTKHIYSHKIVFTSLSGNEGRTEGRKEREKEAVMYSHYL